MKPSPRILVVDDDPEIATMLARALARHGYRIDTTSSPDDALARVDADRDYQAALLDLVMPERDGAALAAALRQKIPGLPLALLTGYTHSPLIPDAERAGVAVFTKPVVIQDLLEFLKSEIG
jgi:CheY-like chemotaxis protein